MNHVVVDTDVVSFLFKNHPIGNRYDPELAGRLPLISFMTSLNWSAGRFSATGTHSACNGCICTCDDIRSSRPARISAVAWAEVTVAAKAAGRSIECADAWIAATGLLYDASLITHNRADYLGVPGLTLVSHPK